MTGLEIWLLAIGLAMDCFCCIHSQRHYIKTCSIAPDADNGIERLSVFSGTHAIAFGWIGPFFSHLIESIDHWIAFAILAFLGGRMAIMESFKDEDCRHEFDPTKLKVVAALAVATSIDALAVGCFVRFSGVCNFASILPLSAS